MSILLETERLILKEMCEADAQGMFELNNDPEVVQYTGDGSFQNIEDALALIRGYDQYENYRMGRLNMFLKTTGEYIGWCGLKYHTDEDVVDLGYRLHKRYWDKGYATEASIACLDYGFKTLDLNKIIAHAMMPNVASIKIMQKLGMTHTADVVIHGEPCVIYTITKDQWK